MPVVILLAVLALGASCSRSGVSDAPSTPSVDGAAMKKHIERLASDEMEGRAPGGKGEQLATAYIADYFKSIGLEPQFQAVPLIGITPTVTPMKLSGKTESSLAFGNDFVVWSRQERGGSVKAELVFCGYGVVAPENGWNDFKGGVQGKIVVVLVNDPQLDDPSKFGGKAMTYYGRWTYKFEEALRQGAAGALIVHETEYAGYGWDVVRGSWSGEQFDIVRDGSQGAALPIQGWITRDVAASLFKHAGSDFDDLKRKALQPDFAPVPTGIVASVDVENRIRRTDSKNVIGVLQGSDKSDENVVITSHWDHLGIGQPQDGDGIFNGAVDNASGMALIMEMARAATRLPAPKRSIVFLAVTAEEQNLLGSAYYAEHPLFPLRRTLANINIDSANIYGRHDNKIQVIGYGYTDLEDILKEVVARQGRTVAPDAEPEKGFYFRSDQFSLAKKGVPALYTKSATTADVADYTTNRYHKASDEFDPSWDMKAAVADGDALLEVAFRVANGDRWPEWRPGTEFRAIREASK